MSHKPLTYFTIFSVAAHAALFGAWPLPEKTAPATHESTIEIGLVTLPKIERDFTANLAQERSASQQEPEMTTAETTKPTVNRPPVPKNSAPSAEGYSGNSDKIDPSAGNSAQADPDRSDKTSPNTAGHGRSPLVATDAAPLTSTNPAPQYPPEALRYGWEGEVWLEVDVDRSGAVERVRVDRSSGYPALDQAALKTVRRWQFEPARVGQEAIDATVRVPVRFRIKRS